MTRTLTIVGAMLVLGWSIAWGAQQSGAAAGQAGALSASDQLKATGCVAKDDQGVFTLNDAAVEVQTYYGPAAAAVKAAPVAQPSKSTFILQGATDL